MTTDRTDEYFAQILQLFLTQIDGLPGLISSARPSKKDAGVTLIDIRPLIGLRYDDGQIVVEDFFFLDYQGTFKLGDYVLFQWKNAGRHEERNLQPRAIHVITVDEGKARAVAASVRTLLANELDSEIAQLRRKEQQLDDEISKQKSEVERLAEERIAELQSAFNQREQEIDARAKVLEKAELLAKEEMKSVEFTKAELVKQQAELNCREMELKPYYHLLPLELDYSEPPRPNNDVDFSDLADQWGILLNAAGYRTGKTANDLNAALSFLIAVCCAEYAGNLVLLNGSVGVGKTNIVERSATILTGCDDCARIVPVRPGWVDSTDLLGYFDPLNNTFRATPFLNAILDASGHQDLLHLVCLDELNLARIENYGADILSRMEYSRKVDVGQSGAYLPLYSTDIELEMQERAQLLKNRSERTQLTDEEQQALRSIDRVLRRYPARFMIPDNVVLLGSLNSDETTYDLSPKVIDRSYVISFPLAGLEEIKDSTPPPPSQALASRILSIGKLRDVVSGALDLDTEGRRNWNQIADWNIHYLVAGLGMPLGFRTERDFKVFNAVARNLGINNPDAILGHFVFTKILPRIRFSKDMSSSDQDCEKLAKSFFKKLEPYELYDPSNVLCSFHRQVDNTSIRTVRYFGTEL